MRKGIHLLLDYWKTANINGTLKIIGDIDKSISNALEPYLNNENVEFISFVHDIDKIYKEADIFILPSLEEGSPLVTYLALGAGLPCIVSPMGGEGIIRHEQEGFVIDPHDKESWVKSLRLLANDPQLRKNQSESARQRSNTFLWEKVGKQRAKLLLEKLQGK